MSKGVEVGMGWMNMEEDGGKKRSQLRLGEDLEVVRDEI